MNWLPNANSKLSEAKPHIAAAQHAVRAELLRNFAGRQFVSFDFVFGRTTFLDDSLHDCASNLSNIFVTQKRHFETSVKILVGKAGLETLPPSPPGRPIRRITQSSHQLRLSLANADCCAVPWRPCRAVDFRAVPWPSVPCQEFPCRALASRAVPGIPVPCRAVPCRALDFRAVPCRGFRAPRVRAVPWPP